MPKKLLSIVIFTHNRCSKLKKTVNSLIPQLTEEVEIFISDNCSSDGTKNYINSLGSNIRRVTHKENIGADLNYIFCLDNAIGDYVWTLCDDDFVRPNIVNIILTGIKTNKGVKFLYLKPYGYKGEISHFQTNPATAAWIQKSSPELLAEVGAWVTFASSAVALRTGLRLDFIRTQIGYSLSPAALFLSVISVNNYSLISEDILVLPQEGEINRYDVFTIFTKNYYKLLKKSKKFGYTNKMLYDAYGICMIEVLSCRIYNWKITKKSLFNLFYYGGRHHLFYQKLLKSLLKRIIKSILGISECKRVQ